MPAASFSSPHGCWLSGHGDWPVPGVFTSPASQRFQKCAQKMESLGDALPLIITRLCEPKEASYNLIRKYLEQHFPHLRIDSR